MKKFLSFILILTLAYSVNAESKTEYSVPFKPSLGINVQGSTLGIGGNVYYNVIPKFTVRAGFDAIGVKFNTDINQSDISLKAKFKVRTSGFSVGADYQFLNFMYVAGGIGLFRFKPEGHGIPTSSISFGDIEIKPETIGTLDIKVRQGFSVSPYLGIGFGKLAPKKKVSFAFEIGTYYMGSPKLDIYATGMLEPSADPDHVATLQKQFKQYRFYPVVKFSLGIKLFTFNKDK